MPGFLLGNLGAIISIALQIGVFGVQFTNHPIAHLDQSLIALLSHRVLAKSLHREAKMQQTLLTGERRVQGYALTTGLVEAVKKQAKLEQRSASAQVRLILAAYIEGLRGAKEKGNEQRSTQ